MSSDPSLKPPLEQIDERLLEDLKRRIGDVIDSVVRRTPEEALANSEHLLQRAEGLLERKQSMQGTKSETRDLVGEILFSRLRRGFREFLGREDGQDEILAAEWAIGAVLGTSCIGELAGAFDRAILKSSSGAQDYSFAGRADFISVEEVMQLLGSGKHLGRLSLEKHDNRLDLFVRRGHVAFFDPHHLVRRVLPDGGMGICEVSRDDLEAAYQIHATGGAPVLLTLAERGCFKSLDLRNVVRQIGCESLWDFLRDREDCRFFYRQLDELPDYAIEHDLRLGVTPILLDGNKRLDDWRSMERVFPDSRAPVEPVADMYARISNLDLGVLEIKMLAFLTGENSPQDLVEKMGLPIFDVYEMLVRFAAEGAVVPPGGFESLQELHLSTEDTIETAFEVLDQNDDHTAVNSALDRVLGDEGGLFGGGGSGGGDGGDADTSSVSLDFLDAAKDKGK